ncbi:MAG: hypothetical protein U0893_26675 [Chloroflexota bacterium]
MIQIALVILLVVLWLLTVTQIGGLDFLRVTALTVGDKSFKVTDFAIGLVIVAVIATMRGPLQMTGIALFVLWVLTLMGIPRVQGIPLEPLILLIIVIGTSVHVVTHRTR